MYKIYSNMIILFFILDDIETFGYTFIGLFYQLYGPTGVHGARVASRAGQARSLEHAPVPGHTLVPETQLKRGLAKTVFVVVL